MKYGNDYISSKTEKILNTLFYMLFSMLLRLDSKPFKFFEIYIKLQLYHYLFHKGTTDRFGGITIDSSVESCEESQFAACLKGWWLVVMSYFN